MWRATQTLYGSWLFGEISILALVWRATDFIHRSTHCSWQFQSSPSCGGRRFQCISFILYLIFQSSPSCGGRLFTISSNSTKLTISILALVWRATITTNQKSWKPRISILALVWRATPYPELPLLNLFNFNPRPRVEGDKTRLYDSIEQNHFNPRPRVEGDRLTIAV